MEQKRILIADDEAESLSILAKKLEENGYSAIAVANGREAIDMSKLNKPDLILLDIALLDIDGYEVAKALRQDRDLRSTPIIFLTGHELEYSGIEKRIAGLGGYDFLLKPFAFHDLLTKIKEAIG